MYNDYTAIILFSLITNLPTTRLQVCTAKVFVTIFFFTDLFQNQLITSVLIFSLYWIWSSRPLVFLLSRYYTAFAKKKKKWKRYETTFIARWPYALDFSHALLSDSSKQLLFVTNVKLSTNICNGVLIFLEEKKKKFPLLLPLTTVYRSLRLACLLASSKVEETVATICFSPMQAHWNVGTTDY